MPTAERRKASAAKAANQNTPILAAVKAVVDGGTIPGPENQTADTVVVPELALNIQEATSHLDAHQVINADDLSEADPALEVKAASDAELDEALAKYNRDDRWTVVAPEDIPIRTRSVGKRKFDDAVDAAFINAPSAILLAGVAQSAVTTLRRNYSALRRTLPVITDRPELPGGELTEYVKHKVVAFSRTGADGIKGVYLQAVPVSHPFTIDTADDEPSDDE